MSRKSSEPLQRELYAAYKSGVSLDVYVTTYRFVKDHVATMAILTYDIELWSIDTYLWKVRKSFDRGNVKGRDVGNAVRMGLDAMEYIDFSWHEELSNDVIIDAMQAGVTSSDYGICKHEGVTLEQLKQYRGEFGKTGDDFHYYAIARSRDVTIESAKRLTVRPSFGEHVVQLLDVGAVSAELIDMLESEVVQREVEGRDLRWNSSSVLQSYQDIRIGAYDRQITVTHEEAREVAELRKIHASREYLRRREEKNGTHERALRLSR